MPGRKNPSSHDNEDLRDFRRFQARLRGEGVVGDQAPGMDILASPRPDAEVRRSKHRENFRR
ncbi:MAG: hypothetical protein QOE90_3179 [Thermoplasmata archaeon]|jgi:hypothetical protein|nr:hypothetical protein [Thermoplasmata archaeon]